MVNRILHSPKARFMNFVWKDQSCEIVDFEYIIISKMACHKYNKAELKVLLIRVRCT